VPGALFHDAAREEADLARYLGGAYDRGRLERYQDVLDEEVAAVADEATLYRTSQAYLYNHTAFAMTGTKLPYLEAFTARVPRGARVLDYGCGIGSDGLLLLDAGYRVEFADFDNPSLAFLRWRLEQRGIDAPVHDLDRHVPGGFDAAYAFDVIEHVPDPHAFLDEMETRAERVMVNLLEFEQHEQPLHYELPIAALLRRAARQRLELYRVLHGSSHLVLYGRGPAGPARRTANVARLVAGQARARVGRARATAWGSPRRAMSSASRPSRLASRRGWKRARG
jgi:SAM-dependent methyltransferase